MKIYEQHILKNVFSIIILIIFTITGLVWLGQILKLLHLFDKDIPLISFILTSLLALPSLIYFILPFGILYSSLITFNSLKINNELIILENAGTRNLKLVLPILKFSLLLVIIGYILSFYVVPYSFHKLKVNIQNFQTNFINNFIQEGIFNKINSETILYIDKKIGPNKFEGIILIDFSNKNIQQIYIAKKSNFLISNNYIYLNLTDGQRQSKNKLNRIDYMSFDNIDIIINTPKIDTIKKTTLQEFYLWELYEIIKSEGENFHKFIPELHNRIIWPLFSILLPFLSISVFLSSEYKRKNYLIELIRSVIISILPVFIHFILLNSSIEKKIFIYFMSINLIVFAIIAFRISFYKK